MTVLLMFVWSGFLDDSRHCRLFKNGREMTTSKRHYIEKNEYSVSKVI